MPPLALQGIVTKVGFMKKTATVTVSSFMVHKLTGKRIARHKKYLVHDAKDKLQQDDLVLIRSCRPISARKYFALDRVLKSPLTERGLTPVQHVQGVEAAPVSTSSTL